MKDPLESTVTGLASTEREKSPNGESLALQDESFCVRI